MKKLTLVTLTGNGRRITVFAMLPYYNGKAVLKGRDWARLCRALGATNGQTISVG